jgi:hypothetical protein
MIFGSLEKFENVSEARHGKMGGNGEKCMAI